MDDRRYRVCEMCGEILPMDTVFAFADERMLVCRVCTTAQRWSALAEITDDRGDGAGR
jgi:RNA polymerase subunit RPABC4/transcription elongation factor Spt4